jgi:hypothetical protein
MQDLLRGLGELSIDPSTRSGHAAGAARALVLAEQALRIDPASTVMRSAATDLQQSADRWTTTDPQVRAQALAAIAATVAGEARRALADAPVHTLAIAPALAGAFTDALRSSK